MTDAPNVAKRGQGGHYLLTYRGRQTTLPMYGDTDLGPIFIKKICRRLGLDPEKCSVATHDRYAADSISTIALASITSREPCRSWASD